MARLPRSSHRLVPPGELPVLVPWRVARVAREGAACVYRAADQDPEASLVQGAAGCRCAELKGRSGADGRFDRSVRRQLDLRRGDLDLICAWPDGDLFTVSRTVG